MVRPLMTALAHDSGCRIFSAVMVVAAALLMTTAATAFTPNLWNARANMNGGRWSQHLFRSRMSFPPRGASTTLEEHHGEGGASSSSSSSSSREERTRKAIRALMSEHDPILLFASGLLPPTKASEASALYAWCRRLDEICDAPDDGRRKRQATLDALEAWESRFDALWADEDGEGTAIDDDSYSEDEYLMDLALRDCIEKYKGDEGATESNNDGGRSSSSSSLLTRQPFDDMIQGMKSDLVLANSDDDTNEPPLRTIASLDELEVYAYRVAGTVGLMLLPLLLEGTSVAAVQEAKAPAVCLGQAIQLVNILRDATQDAKLGRIYLPQDLLRAHDVSNASILEAAKQASLSENAEKPVLPPPGYTSVVRIVADRAHELLVLAEKGRSTLSPPLGPLLVQIIVELYRDYLNALERRGFDNLCSCGGDRVRIGTPRKIAASLRALARVIAAV